MESEPATVEQEGRTCFTVTLLPGNKYFENTPYLQEQEPVAKPMIQEPEIVKSLTSPVTSGDKNNELLPTILVAEDNAELRLLIRETFQTHYKV